MKTIQGRKYKLYNCSMLDMLDVLEKGSIDSIVTDPPYELNFMGKGWDNSGIAFQADTWKRCLDVLKPGGYLLAFGGSRTFHRIAVAIEDAGFEIRDVIMWLYGSGFPKSMNLGKSVESKLVNGSANTQAFKELKGTKAESTSLGLVKRNADFGYKSRDYGLDGHKRTVEVDYQTEFGKRWDGWGTALKPSYEPIIVARKPCEGSCTDNVLKYGVGGINIDECRVGSEELHNSYAGNKNGFTSGDRRDEKGKGLFSGTKTGENVVNGRFPANTILTYDDADFDEVCGGMPIGRRNGSISKEYKINNQVYGDYKYCNTFEAYEDSGSAARYFYCAKAGKRDRDEGLELFDTKQCTGGGGGIGDYLTDVNSCSGKFGSEKAPHKNTHPTVKPTSLMQYLVRLVTPGGVQY